MFGVELSVIFVEAVMGIGGLRDVDMKGGRGGGRARRGGGGTFGGSSREGLKSEGKEMWTLIKTFA